MCHNPKGIIMAKAKHNVAKAIVKAIKATPAPAPTPAPAANNAAMGERERNAKIADLWKRLSDNKGDRGIGRKTRRALRALGHRGGLATPAPTV